MTAKRGFRDGRTSDWNSRGSSVADIVNTFGRIDDKSR